MDEEVPKKKSKQIVKSFAERKERSKEINVIATTYLVKLAEIGCTKEEIVYITGIARTILDRNYSDLYNKGRANLKLSLRRLALERANTSDTILKKLLEQYVPDMQEQLTIYHKDLEQVESHDLIEICKKSNGKVSLIGKATDG